MMQPADSSGTGPPGGLAYIFDQLGRFILAHSGKTELIAVLLFLIVIWVLWALTSKKRELDLTGGIRLCAAVLSISGGLITGAVLLFLQKPDCSELSAENQVLAGFVALLAGIAMGAKELKECFSSKKEPPPADKQHSGQKPTGQTPSAPIPPGPTPPALAG